MKKIRKKCKSLSWRNPRRDVCTVMMESWEKGTMSFNAI
jgi:hypothetical protein